MFSGRIDLFNQDASSKPVGRKSVRLDSSNYPQDLLQVPNGAETPGFNQEKKFSFNDQNFGAAANHDATLMMMEDNDDVSSLNSDFIQPRFLGGKNNSDGSGEDSSEMEAMSNDEEVKELLRQHRKSFLFSAPVTKTTEIETQTEPVHIAKLCIALNVGTQTEEGSLDLLI